MIEQYLSIFWLFIKVNLLTTSGPASVGLLYKEAVGKLLTETQFVEAVGFSQFLPGSDALQLAMFIGYHVGGILGALAALLGSILPPTLIMLGVVIILQRLRNEAWIASFVRGLAPAVAALMVLVAWKIFNNGSSPVALITIVIAGLSLIALRLKVPSPLVLLGAGIIGIIFLR
jgi:chromate transporter